MSSEPLCAIHVSLGGLYRLQDDRQQAMAHYQQAAILAPYAPEPHYGLALVCEAQGLCQQYMSEWQRYDELAGEGR